MSDEPCHLGQDYLARRINPNLVGLLPHPLEAEGRMIHPRELVTPERFDLLAKYEYAISFLRSGSRLAWQHGAYSEHVRVFNGGVEYNDRASAKLGISSFKRSFHETIQSIYDHGFDNSQSIIPVSRDYVILDGAHRVAAALACGCEIPIAKFDVGGRQYDYRFFQRRGMRRIWQDALAQTFCRLSTRPILVLIRGKKLGSTKDIREWLARHMRIAYERRVQVPRRLQAETWGSSDQKRPYKVSLWIGQPEDNMALSLFGERLRRDFPEHAEDILAFSYPDQIMSLASGLLTHPDTFSSGQTRSATSEERLRSAFWFAYLRLRHHLYIDRTYYYIVKRANRHLEQQRSEKAASQTGRLSLP